MDENNKINVGIDNISAVRDSSKQIWIANNWTSVDTNNYATTTWAKPDEVVINNSDTATVTKFEGIEFPRPLEIPRNLDLRSAITVMLNAWIEDAEKLKKIKKVVEKAKNTDEINRAKQEVNEDWQEFFGK